MSSNLRRYDVSLSSKGKAIASDGKTEKRMEELQKPDINLCHQHFPVEENTTILSPQKELPPKWLYRGTGAFKTKSITG
ncbi:unnamed protein product [Prunus armeniaca]|uniref:Uncharacterized protein n=1 Tax=Prunus armeniaca TaxID=36596 RepID=A0A6J5X019_PRUAR|nr:unnamed protein product [Prunus armeniaca]